MKNYLSQLTAHSSQLTAQLAIILALFLFGMTSCTQEKNQFKEESINLSRVRKLETAIAVVKKQALLKAKSQNSNSNTRVAGEFITLNAFSFNDKNGLAALYAINYSLDGKNYFNMINADTHLQPLIAYGDNLLDKNNLPPAFIAWAASHVLSVETARGSDPDIALNPCDGGGTGVPPLNDHPAPYPYTDCNPCACAWAQGFACDPVLPSNQTICENFDVITNEVGPLMSSVWTQGCFYNDKLASCTNPPEFCNKELTGCVATAVGQVMNFHQAPANFDWANILDDYNVGTPTFTQIDKVSSLLFAVGTALGTSYSCTGSSADICANNKVVDVLTNTYGYSSANACIAYPFEPAVIDNINDGQPVIIEGEYLANGHTTHAWVCDGYADRTFCRYDCATDASSYYTLQYFHMNFGWGANARTGNANGYFLFADPNSGISNLKMIGSIQP